MPRSQRKPTCYFCNVTFDTDALHQTHMRQLHFQCAKCEFWLAAQLDQYDHTCVPTANSESFTADIIIPTDEREEREENKNDTVKETTKKKTKSKVKKTSKYTTAESHFRWKKCEAHKPYVCTLEEISNCSECSLMRWKHT